jgi:radical SAM protein with 4Fe4S-binding SPASM domain
VTHEFVGNFFENYKRSGEAPNTSTDAESGNAPTPKYRETTIEVLETIAEPVNRIFTTAGQGSTKDCFDPWNYSQIKADGTVYPCCAHSPIGKVTEGTSYAEILDGTKLDSLRQSLLNGNLDNECKNCHMRADIPISEYQTKYRRIFDADGEKVGPISVPPWLVEPKEQKEIDEPLRLGIRSQAARFSRRLLKFFRHPSNSV